MNRYRLAASAIFAGSIVISAVLPVSAAFAQSFVPQCLTAVTDADGNQMLVRDPSCSASSPVYPSVTPAVYPVRVAEPYRQFEWFNSSDQDITYLHISPVHAPNQTHVYGGSRTLPPGRAWTVNLNQGCQYNLLVEFADGSQNYLENVNTCSYQGIQLQ